MNFEPFLPGSFAKALSNAYTKQEVVETKPHFRYFLRYLGDEGLQAKYMVIEEGYISRDYLHDYAAYYSLCFKPYDKFCRRIHFFNTTLTENLLRKVVLGSPEIPPGFWDSYLGFIVVKPIPTTLIGFTLLKNYAELPDREWWGLRPYKVHVFGHEVTYNSLAFQEQDSVLSACATTAIWSMLNKASKNDHCILKTPNEITKDAAGNLSTNGSRLFPNSGLSVSQICQAIFNSGLAPEVRDPDSAFVTETLEKESEKTCDTILEKEPDVIETFVSNLYTKKILNAYAPLGIPIILVIKVPGADENVLHAITVNGFRKTPIVAREISDENSWIAENINRIYAHDDQWGPYVRIDLENEGDLNTPWTEEDEAHRPTKVTNIVVPVFPKVRISFEDIEAVVLGLDATLTEFFKNKIRYDLVWNIQIEFSETFKSGIKNSALDESTRLNVLSDSLPKYLWVATCYVGTNKLFQFTFDATDVNNGMIGQHMISYMPVEDNNALLDYLLRNETILKSVSSKRASLHYFDFLVSQLKSEPGKRWKV